MKRLCKIISSTLLEDRECKIIVNKRGKTIGLSMLQYPMLLPIFLHLRAMWQEKELKVARHAEEEHYQRSLRVSSSNYGKDKIYIKFEDIQGGKKSRSHKKNCRGGISKYTLLKSQP